MHEFDSGLFVGRPAWHGLGTVVKEAPTTADAIKLAGLDWRVEETSLEFAGCPGYKRLNRSDTGGLLHVCRDSWTVVQNQEAFSWFDPLIQDGDVQLETAIALRHGERVVILARIVNSQQSVLPNDSVEQFLLLHNSHAGNGMGVLFTNVRVVCANTLASATRGARYDFAGDAHWDGKSARFKHTRSIHANLTAVREAIDVQKRSWRYTIEQYRAMAQTSMSTELFRAYLEQVFAKDLQQAKRSRENPDLTIEQMRSYPQLCQNFHEGRGMDLPGVGGTVWAGYQAVTEYLTHQQGHSAKTRLESQWFGNSRRLVATAHEQAVMLTRA